MSIFKIFNKKPNCEVEHNNKMMMDRSFSVGRYENVEFKQKVKFDEHYMGRRRNFSHDNARRGFKISKNCFISARDDYKSQVQANTLRSMASLPKDLSVPVFLATTSKFGHIGVWHHGKLYVDGVIDNKQLINAICWAETISGVRVVEVVKHGSRR